VIGDIVGALGFILAVIALTWEIHRYRQEQKRYREEQKEKISICRPGKGCSYPAGGSATAYLSVCIVNIGRVPVYLDRVELRFEDTDGWVGHGFTPRLQMEGPEDPLAPGEGRDYFLTSLSDEDFDQLECLPPDEMWIAAHSYKAELARFESYSLKFMLASLRKERQTLADGARMGVCRQERGASLAVPLGKSGCLRSQEKTLLVWCWI
jgi:hypothetical protein